MKTSLQLNLIRQIINKSKKVSDEMLELLLKMNVIQLTFILDHCEKHEINS